MDKNKNEDLEREKLTVNIVVVTDGLDLGSGGVGTFVNDLCLALKKENNRILLVGIVEYNYKDDLLLQKLLISGIELFDVGAKSRKDALEHFPRYVRKLSEYIKKWSNGQATICNVHLKLGVLYGAIASIVLPNVKCVETYHNTYHWYHLQCWTLSPIIKKYICVSNTAKEEMHRRFLIPQSRVISIPNGVDRNKIRNEIGVLDKESNEEILVLSVGRLSPEKNFIVPIKAYQNIEGYRYRYIVIGDGPQKKEAETLVSEHEILLGKLERTEVFRYLALADIVVMPSLWEGRSILMLEAAAFNIPFILSDVPGLREPFNAQPLNDNEIYRRTEFGYLVKTDNEEAYKKALVDYITHPELHKAMSNAVEKMSENNDMKKVAGEYLKVFQTEIEK